MTKCYFVRADTLASVNVILQLDHGMRSRQQNMTFLWKSVGEFLLGGETSIYSPTKTGTIFGAEACEDELLSGHAMERSGHPSAVQEDIGGLDVAVQHRLLPEVWGGLVEKGQPCKNLQHQEEHRGQNNRWERRVCQKGATPGLGRNFGEQLCNAHLSNAHPSGTKDDTRKLG